MKQVELYARVRHAVRIEGMSERAAARRFGIDRQNGREDAEVLGAAGVRAHEAAGAAEAGRRSSASSMRILAEDKERPKKQRHTSKRIFERLRDEHGFTGGITIVKDYVAGWRQRARRCSCRSCIRRGMRRSTSARPSA